MSEEDFKKVNDKIIRGEFGYGSSSTRHCRYR